MIPNVRDLLEGHISLELESIDRLYLNGYVPQLQHGAGLVGFLCQQRGKPIASPALLGQITGRFVAEVKSFAKEQGIPLFHFERDAKQKQQVGMLRPKKTTTFYYSSQPYFSILPSCTFLGRIISVSLWRP